MQQPTQPKGRDTMAPDKTDYLHQEMQQLRSEQRDGFKEVRDMVATLREELLAKVSDNSKRIGKLEQWRERVLGSIAAVASMGGFIGAGLTLAIQWIRGR